MRLYPGKSGIYKYNHRVVTREFTMKFIGDWHPAGHRHVMSFHLPLS